MLVLIIIEIILALLLIILILLQGSDNEGLGLGGGGGSLGGLMTARGSANFLSRSTAVVAALFMIMSIILTIVASSGDEKNVLESLTQEGENASDIIEEPANPDTN